jgi:serine phosphatase RsbU (regulator of sigma subunit)
MERPVTAAIPQGSPSDAMACPWPLAFTKRESFAKGDFLFRAGDKADKMFYITKGLILLPEINKTVQAGQILGEMGIFSPQKERTASARCIEDLEVLTMGRDDVLQCFSRDPSLAINLIQLSVSRLIDNLRVETESRERLKSELRIAQEIQASMLPRNFPLFPERQGFEIYATMDPAREVGGDFYDFFMTGPDKLCLVVGDVSGKGVPAALFMSISKSLLKSEVSRGLSLAQAITRVNSVLSQDNPLVMFVTVFCATLDLKTGELECCNAGHNLPFIWSASTGVRTVDAPAGVAVGVVPESEFFTVRFRLQPHDLLLLYTDGVTEATNPKNQLFSERRLSQFLATVGDKDPISLIGAVRREVANHADTAPQSDDMTLLAVRYLGLPNRQPASAASSSPVRAGD